MSKEDTAFQAFEARKKDHIELALKPENQAVSHALDQVELIHEALPELDFADISIQHQRFGQVTQTPFLISSMTAGHAAAEQLNRLLAACAAERGWAMGVGSQRRELDDAKAKAEWQSIRADFPELALFGNLGLSQLITHGSSAALQLVDNLAASAMIIHTNPLQECLQPEGTPQFKGGLKALSQLCQDLSVPVILKETGCGFSAKTLQKLNDTGIRRS